MGNIFSPREKRRVISLHAFSPTLWHLLPDNYFDMPEMVGSHNAINFYDPCRHQIPAQDVIFHRHHLIQDDQFCGQLAPQEPN
jgi:hypothetical protein